MELPNLFDICSPREDVLKGTVSEADFAADLAQVLRGDAPIEYRDPVKFFANTYPTRGLRDLCGNVCRRLLGDGSHAGAIFRLHTNYGGGKTHLLIALVHIVLSKMEGVPHAEEFVSPDVVPRGRVRVAAFDGENADPANGRRLGEGVRAFTPWGEIAYLLAGREGYERVRRSDEEGVAPGSQTIRELFGGEPALILLDELSVYLRKLKARDRRKAGGQLTAFLTALFKAVESSPDAALVYTLAIGKGGIATDAYSEENQFIADKMEEAESVSARKATLLDPTEEDETVKVLRRRLFERIDDGKAAEVVEAYRGLWDRHRDLLPPAGAKDYRLDRFKSGYPLHPEVIDTLKEKTSTLGNFQRVRGMLRLLARTVAVLWEKRPKDAYAVHLHHIDPGFEPVRQEIVTRLGQHPLVPAIRADVAAGEGEQPSLARELDSLHYAGLPPYASYAARTILLHTLAFNESLKGVSPDRLRYSIISPGTDLSFIDDACRRFVSVSSYLDDRPNMPLRFLTEANLNQMVRRQEKQVDPGEARSELNDRIKGIFGGAVFNLVPFPSVPNEIPDDAGDGKPYLALVGYDAEEVSGDRAGLPELVRKLFREKGSSGDLRMNRNNLVFVAVDAHRKDEMRKSVVRHLALRDLKRPERLNELAEHQRDLLLQWHKSSQQQVAVNIQQAYRHVFYPSRNRAEGADVDLGHTVVEVPSASASPGDGQKQIVHVLREINKLRLPEDEPDSPTYIRDRTPLRKGRITTATLREEFRRDPVLPVLTGDDVFVKGIRQGVESGEFVYQSGDLLWGRGDPWAEIRIDEQSFLYTAAHAKENDIWPLPKMKPEPPKEPVEPPPGTGERVPGAPGAKPPTGTAVPEPPPADKAVSEEGVLKEALTRIWEKARSRKFSSVSSLLLKLYDSGDGLKMLGAVGAIPKTTQKVTIEGGYQTPDGSELNIEFKGTVNDARPLKDFLDPQIRAAADKDVSVVFNIAFTQGLPLDGDEPKKTTDRLCRFGAGAAYVRATAEGEVE